MDRITDTFTRAQAEKRAAFVAYLCAGDPDFDTSLAACRTLLKNGVDVLELGVPFSDPLADGLTNQLAAQRALASGMTAERVFALVKAVRAEFPTVPIVFYTYYNLVFSNGSEAYLKAAREAGVDGMLTLDLPPEEATELSALARAQGIKTVFIVAPTTPQSRLKTITGAATGFIYYVSREGVTGVRDSVADNISTAVAQIKAVTRLPVVVGFGISKREHVATVAQHADGVVVGSALVNCIRANLGKPDAITQQLQTVAKDLAVGLARA
ncbi:MAG TPA: tryptophan synthase subunit alpha [Opitutaceae bacterium]|nr:tryptophan synthase subunit alpha [Opitutaceae bacterium]